PIVFAGQSAPALELARDYPWLTPKTQQARDVERFRWFSEGFVARDPDHPARVIDIRYSMVPNHIEALWGIELDASAPADAHARFVTARRLSPAHRAELTQMLWPSPED
nr:metal-dependent hydrolase [Planctomycetota bacterium]